MDTLNDYLKKFGRKNGIDNNIEMFSSDYAGKIVLVPGTLACDGKEYYIWTKKGPSKARITNPEKVPKEKKLENGKEGIFYGKLKLVHENLESIYLNFEFDLYGCLYLDKK
jgi:hypothetical protein